MASAPMADAPAPVSVQAQPGSAPVPTSSLPALSTPSGPVRPAGTPSGTSSTSPPKAIVEAGDHAAAGMPSAGLFGILLIAILIIW
jgi:hypothetical protein